MKLKTFTVSEVNRYIKSYINGNPILSNIKIEGEISNFKLYDSGHSYFSLKDESSKISCVIFRGVIEDIIDLYDGLKVEITGSISVYEKDGRYQIYVKKISESGLGNLFVKFEELKRKLDSEGLFDETHKKGIPKFQDKIALITSPKGAALRDIISVAQRRNPMTDLLILPVTVQGENSKYEIVDAIKVANSLGNIDLIIISRGGGSIEELWSFNEEIVAREIYNSDIPIISAVGHETDFTISDFVADMRAPTPSAAAEMAVADMTHIKNMIIDYYGKAMNIAENKIFNLNNAMKSFSKENLVEMMEKNIALREKEVAFTYEKSIETIDRKISDWGHSMEKSLLRMDGVNPLNQFKKGYAIVENKENDIVKSVVELSSGDEIKTIFSDGEIVSRILKISKKGV
jgi:exodeoxyribonuclease VII large subunit